MVGHIEIELEPGSDVPVRLPDAPPPRRRRRWRAVAAVGALVAVTVTVAVWNDGHRRDAAAPTSTTATTDALAPTTTASAATALAAVPAAGATHVVVRLGDGALYEVVPATAHAAALGASRLGSGTNVGLVAGTDWLLVRPADDTAGVLLDATGASSALTGGLDQAAFAVFPGRTAASVWLATGAADDVTLTLYGLDGVPLGAPRHMVDVHHLLGADGNGEVAVASSSGAYVTTTGGWARLTTGRVLALGPTVAVVEECDAELWCRDLVVDRASGTRRVLVEPASRSNGDGVLGAVSADGTRAVLSDGCGSRLDTLDLATGALTMLAVTDPGDALAPVWSPDGALLWFVDATHHLSWWSPTTATSGATVSPVHWFALRPLDA